MLGWLYFKDHPKELEHVEQSGEGFKLKKELILYLENMSSKFGPRIALLKQVRSRTEPEPYEVCSKVVYDVN